MKFGRQGIMILILLGLVALVVAMISPAIFIGPDAMASRQNQQISEWKLAAKGVIESESEVEISSQITGVIKDVLVKEGDRVRAGQPLILFDDAKMVARLKLAEAVLRQSQAHLTQLERGYRIEDIEAAQGNAERTQAILVDRRNEMARIERLFKAGAVTEAARDQAKLDYDIALAETREGSAQLRKLQKGPRSEEISSARADMNRAKAELDFTKATLKEHSILSPIDGLVIDRAAEEGETVDVKTPLLMIIDPDKLRIWAELEEADVGKVLEGQSLVAEVDALPNQQLPGKVTQVFNSVQRKRLKAFDPVASFDVNTQKIHIALENYEGLVHGMTVTVIFNQ